MGTRVATCVVQLHARSLCNAVLLLENMNTEKLKSCSTVNSLEYPFRASELNRRRLASVRLYTNRTIRLSVLLYSEHLAVVAVSVS